MLPRLVNYAAGTTPSMMQNPYGQPSIITAQPSIIPTPMMATAPFPAMCNNNNNNQQTVVVNTGGDVYEGIATRLFVDPMGLRGWSSGLFSCLNELTSCLCGSFCWVCLLCRVANRMKECACVWCTVPCGLAAMRVKLRTMGGIKGSICNDCCIVTWCSCCALCQMSRELDAMRL